MRRHLQQAGAAVALLKEAVIPDGLRTAAAPILSSTERRTQMAQQARALGRPDAAEHLTDVLLEAAL
ncbi:hypothetical protein [Streptomyces sp. NPDC096132]|uniref:hypothetical protein n=1 Tax=Streptomyces sp. NPDC096132 TaxID=3366075 RepID=UPI00381171A8